MLYRSSISTGGTEPRLAFSNEHANQVYLSLLKKANVASPSAAQKVFLDNFNELKELVKRELVLTRFKDIEKFVENVKNLQIVLIECKNQSAAFDLFESINGTSVTLASNDLVKNRIFQMAHENSKGALKKSEDLWSVLETNLDHDSRKLKTFMRHHWLSTFGYTNHKKLFKDFEKMLEAGSPSSRADRSAEYLESLVKDSQIYRSLLLAQVESLKGVPMVRFEKEQLRKTLEFLGYLGVDQVYSVLLHLYRKSPKTFLKDANRLVAFQFLYNNVPGSPSAPEKIFANLAERKKNKEEVFVELRKLCSGLEDVFVENLLKKMKYREGKSGDVQFILEKYVISKGAGTGFSEPTVEHIIPRSTGDTKLLELVHSIGNLTILERSENGALTNKSVTEKLQVYKRVWKVNQSIKRYRFEINPQKAIEKRGVDMAIDVYEMFLKTLTTGKWK
jgi:hypothetical protein